MKTTIVNTREKDRQTQILCAFALVRVMTHGWMDISEIRRAMADVGFDRCEKTIRRLFRALKGAGIEVMVDRKHLPYRFKVLKSKPFAESMKMKKKKKAAASKKKTATKKKVAIVKKKPAKAAAKKGYKTFYDWWSAVAVKKVDKIERDWLKANEPNDPNEEGGGDHWHVNEMMHSGDAHEMTAEVAEEVFNRGKNNEPWEFGQSDSLYCDLDDVIIEAYQAGKDSR